jgi:predicted enzyme related to lactoylglutathione lyase
MVSTLRNITVDCTDAPALARFWAEALGWNVFSDDDPEVLVTPCFPRTDAGSPTMLFIPVPEPRTVKNRAHIDLEPSDRTRDEEVARLVALGAKVVEDHRTDEGLGWVWMADPEGNDFCVERGAAERGAVKPRHWRLVEDD